MSLETIFIIIIFIISLKKTLNFKIVQLRHIKIKIIILIILKLNLGLNDSEKKK